MGNIKKNDMVMIIQGKDSKKTGKVISVKEDKVIVAGMNMVKKMIKPKSQQEKGGIISIEAPLHISNVMLVSKGKISRVGVKIENNKKQRIAKKTGELL